VTHLLPGEPILCKQGLGGLLKYYAPHDFFDQTGTPYPLDASNNVNLIVHAVSHTSGSEPAERLSGPIAVSPSSCAWHGRKCTRPLFDVSFL
jgi:hypothetical protein